jgi:DNA-directed RNA polymerase specialized sigma24 family protein
MMARRLSSYEDERDTFVMESLRQAEGMIRNIAIRHGADYEDLYQVAAEHALKYCEHAMCAVNPRAYLQKAIQTACLRYLNLTSVNTRKRQLSDYYRIVSLDKPLRVDSEATLESVVAAIDHISREYPQEVYDAVQSLPEKCYVPLCMRYGLFGYPPHTWREMSLSLRIAESTLHDRVCRAVELLRERLSEEVLHG